MAKLSFDVSAKWQEVQKLREEVEALKTALKDFNVAGDMKGFEELNKKYQESTQKLKEYEQQVQNYQRIIDQLNVSNGVMEGARQMASELNNATDVFVEQQLKVKALNEDVKKLNKSYLALSDIDKRGQKGSNILTELKEITHQYTIENEALKKLRKEYSDNIKIEGVAADSLVSLRKQLSLLNAEYDRLSASDRKAAIGTDLQKQIQSLNTEISAAEQATGRYQRNVGNYASAWNGLGMSVQQVARELPSLAIGWNTFFLAISNNLPMLADELKKASAEYKAFKAAVAAGNNDVAKVAPVWKQLISSIFSWQTALVVAITMLSVYGKDIIEWTKNLFGADTAQKRLNESLKEFNNLVEKGQANAKLLFDAVKRTEEGTQGRANAIREINKAYGEYLPYLLSEKSSLDELNNAYKVVTKSIQEATAAKVQQKAIDEATEDSIKNQVSIMDDLEKSVSKTYGIANQQLSSEIVKGFRDSIEESYNQGENSIKAASKAIAKIRDKYQIKDPLALANLGNELKKFSLEVYKYNNDVRRIREQYNPFFDKEQADQAIIENKKHYETMKSQAESYLNSIAADQKKLLDAGKFEGIDEETVRRYKEARANIQEATKQLHVYDSYDKQNKAAEKEAEKQAKEQKKIQKRINNELLELQRRNEQSRIDLMEEGSDKRIAQIEYDYDREIEAIRKKEKEWREAQGGKLTQEQTVEIKTAVTQAKTTRMRSTQEVEYEQVEAQRKAMNDYLKEYGSYQEKKMALAVEYGQKIADAETEGEKLMLGKQWDKELLDLEIKTKNSSNAIIALFGDMRDKSLKELQELASKGQEALDFIKNGKWDATVGSKLGITEDEFRRWQEAPEAIRQAGESLRGVKDQAETLQPAFDKVTQGLKRFFAAGNDPKKLTESLQLINEGVNEVTSSVQFLSNTFGKLGDSFGGVFSGIAEGLNIAMDAVNSTMQGAQAGAMFGPIGAAAGAAIGVVSSLASAIAKIHDKKNEKRIQKLQDQIDVLDASYEKLGRSIEKAYSTDASQLIDQQNKLLEQQKLLIQQQIKEEQDKKKSDDNRIKEWQKQLYDINAQLEENKEKAIEAITGTDVMSAIDEFAKAYADAWATGENAAESSAKAVQTLIKTAIIEFLKKKLSPSVQDFMKQLADYMSDGIVSPWEEAELNKLKEKMDKEAQEIFENSGKWLKDESKYEQQATSGGFEVMSQDSANELNGRFTALQMIGEEILLYLQSSNQIANLLCISASIDSINIRIASLYDIADETRVMMANIYIELQQISDNTGDTVKQLKEVVSKLTKIENNTNNL
nr:MAG TPA: tail tape measure protein [Caudoviricetes sp.]